MPEAEKNVTISRDRYLELLEAEAVLAALESGGVDNWMWYDDSIADHYIAPVID